MKKVVIILVIAILVVAGFVGFNFYKGKKKNNSTGEITQEVSYGKRGNITESERIKFLSQNDEYLVGMMGLAVSNDVKNFSNDDMIRFALNVAVERYSSMLDTKKNKDGSEDYVINEKTVNKITEDFFGLDSVSFDKTTNPYYSKSNKAFLFGENTEKTLYYYPVSQENKEDGSVEIIVDAIFVSDDQDAEKIDKAKYEGKYGQDNVDNTLKFIFNANGKLISYQYIK